MNDPCPFCESPILHPPPACPAGVKIRPRPEEVTVRGDPEPTRRRLHEEADPSAERRRKLLGGRARPLPPSGGKVGYVRATEEIAGVIWGYCLYELPRLQRGNVMASDDFWKEGGPKLLVEAGHIDGGDAAGLLVRDACQMLENLGVIRVIVRGRDDSFVFTLTEQGAKTRRVDD